MLDGVAFLAAASVPGPRAPDDQAAGRERDDVVHGLTESLDAVRACRHAVGNSVRGQGDDADTA